MALESASQREHPPMEPGYRAFLLRCWREPGVGPDGEPAWRFTVTQPGDERSRRGFASLEDLVAYLREELEMGDPESSRLPPGRGPVQRA